MALQFGQWVAMEIVTKREVEMGLGVRVRGCGWVAGKPDRAGRTASSVLKVKVKVYIAPHSKGTSLKKRSGMARVVKRCHSFNALPRV